MYVPVGMTGLSGLSAVVAQPVVGGSAPTADATTATADTTTLTADKG